MAIKLRRLGCVFTHKPLIPSGVDKVHVGTELQLSYNTDFSIEDELIKNPNGVDGRHIVLSRDGYDITAPYTEIEVDSDRVIYIRYRLLFDSKSNPTNRLESFETSDWSRISSTSSRDSYTLNNIIISTPSIFMEQSTGSILEENIKFNVDGYLVIKGDGAHTSTSWYVEDNDGNILYKREKDVDNKTSIQLPSKLFSEDKIYVVKAKFHNELGGESNLGAFIYNPNITNLSNFELKPILPFSKGQSLYFRFMLLRPNITKLGIIIKENRYDSEIEVYRKDDIQPSASICISDSDLTVGKSYKVYAFTIVNEQGFEYSSALTKVCEFTFQEPMIYPILASTDYPDFYGDLGRISTGNVVVNTAELKNGLFVMGGNSVNKLCLYGRYGSGIRKTKIEFELPMTAGDLDEDPSTLLPYINVLPMYNDMIAVNYALFNGNTYKRSFWAFFNVDLVNNEVTLIGPKEKACVTFADEYLGTALSSSAVVAKDNTIYYIPSGYVPTNDFEDLPMFSLKVVDTGRGYEIIREKVIDVVKEGIKRHMTMCPYNTNIEGNEDFLILGGTTDEEFNEISSSGELQRGVTYFKIANHDVLNFNTRTKEITTLGFLSNDVGGKTNFPEQLYNFAAYRRADGKIVLFNNSNTGDTKYNSASYVIDLSKLTIETDLGAKKERNETRIDLPFRSTVSMRNGDFVRFSYAAAMYNYALLYSHTPLLTYTDAEISINKNLIVRPGEFITVENLYIYDTVIIEGTSVNNTGRIKWIDKNRVITLDFRDRVFTRDAEMTSAEYASIPTQHLWILDGVDIKITD